MPDAPAPDPAVFALALLRLDGVGQVTAGRLLRPFSSYEALLNYPREQVLARIKGAPRAQALVTRLFDRDAMAPELEAAAQDVQALEERGVTVLTAHHTHWPTGLGDLPRGQQPVVLYAYGPTAPLARPAVALLARPPLPDAPFELAQALTRHLLAHDLVPASGVAHGFDVVVQKLTAAPPPHPGIMVTAMGMAHLPRPMRPTVSQGVHAGGVLCSPFPMMHGPFEHDDKERALVQTALARAAVFVAPRPETPEWQAMTWALEADRPVFGLAAPDTPLPERVHPIAGEVDFDWVVAAARGLSNSA